MIKVSVDCTVDTVLLFNLGAEMKTKIYFISSAVILLFILTLFTSGCAPTSWGTLITSGTSPVDLNGKAQIVGEVKVADNLNALVGLNPYNVPAKTKGLKTQLEITQLGIKTESSDLGKFYFNDLKPGQYKIVYNGDSGEKHEAVVSVEPNQTLHLALYVQKDRKIYVPGTGQNFTNPPHVWWRR